MLTTTSLLAIASGGLASQTNATRRPSRSAELSEEFFTRGSIPSLRIQVTGPELKELLRDHRKYVRATVIDGTNVFTDVGLHLKGAAGSFREFHDKPALTLNFDKFKPGQNFHGLDKLHLNNSVQDPSYLTELVCGAVFREAGVPTPRAAWARVELNGRDRGLYVLKEGFDRAFLRRYFRDSDGNLYDGGFVTDVTEPLRRESGTGPAGHSDLSALVRAAEEPDPVRRLARLEQVLNLDQFITFVALEVLMWDWDGYPMNHNNYRLYFDPTSRHAVFMPHGMDQMFWDPNGAIYPPMNGLVARAVLETPAGRERYRERLRGLLDSLFTAQKLTNLVDAAHARMRPVLAAVSAREARAHDGIVADLKERIVQRIASVRHQLEHEPKPLQFDAGGAATLGNWQPRDDGEVATVTRSSVGDQRTLHIRMRDSGVASWRTRVLLPGGVYRFEARVKTAGVRALRDEKGEGAGLRISGSDRPRDNKLTGDSDWQRLSYAFRIEQPLREVELVAELRARSGEAWFDETSLHLVRE
jgi:hypothetical protein